MKMSSLFYILTPGNVRVSSKHVLVLSDYGNSVAFPITIAMEGTCCPTVIRGAVTQLPN